MPLSQGRTDIVLGIDVGTQSAKCVALDSRGLLRGVGQSGYDVLTPRPLWAEQDPHVWWHAVELAVGAAVQQANLNPKQVRGIGLTGQMHGVVVVGHDHQPLRPAIIWMDRRSAALCDTIQGRVPPTVVTEAAGNRLSPGFAGASLAWLGEAEPSLLDQASAVLQAKDYLVLRLSGEISSEPSDASATWLFDVVQRQWSEPLAEACGVASRVLPSIHESAAIVGQLRQDVARALSLPAGIPIVAGAGDQAALLLGVGVIEPGRGSITLGTGGQMTVVSADPHIDPCLRLNTFCHAAPDRWYTMGAILNAGLALRWWRSVTGADGALSYPALLEEAAQIPPGAEGLIFLPYLEGERTPHMDPDATGAFIGLNTRHTRAHMTRAVLEGVAFAFRDCLQTLQTVGSVPEHFLVGGGGAQGALWRHILASVLGVSLQTVEGREHTSVGAAMLAGVGTDLFEDLSHAVAQVVRYGAHELPEASPHTYYNEGYARFKALYPVLRSVR